MRSSANISPWSWIPSLYFVQGLPNIVVTAVAVIMLNKIGVSNTENSLYTSLLYLPWVIKPFWSPIVESIKTKRLWIISMQILLILAFLALAFVIPLPNSIRLILASFWFIAFASATQDIAIDGFYMLSLKEKQQAFFVGIRSTAYRLAMLFGQGPLVIFAGYMEKHSESIHKAWSTTFYVFSALFIILFVYHTFVIPKAKNDQAQNNQKLSDVLRATMVSVKSFFKKPQIGRAICFFLVFRLGEAQLSKITNPFMLDKISEGGLGISTEDVGLVYGTFGLVALIAGGVLGGILVSRDGLKRWIWTMVCAINLPNVVFIILASLQINHLGIVSSFVAIEQFGYGFGFTAYMLYMIQVAEGEFKTSHYALCTGFMTLGLMLPGMVSGWIEELLGYKLFFVWVMICTIPSFLIIPYLSFHNDKE